MSAIFGIVRRDGAPLHPGMLETMRRAMADWGPDGSEVRLNGCCGLGQARLHSTPEAHYDRLPYVDTAGGSVFTATARLDNRGELIHSLGIGQSDAETMADGELLRQAYLRWGDQCVERVYGDWSFAAWHPNERRLFLARDHFGNTALYYYADARICAFASSRKALLALQLAPVKMDELYLAQLLVSWTAYHGERTIHTPLKRLPPAHCLTVMPERIDKRLYWQMENTAELHLNGRDEYVAAFREHFDSAVRARLRSTTSAGIAVTLSGGLDSGSVSVTAAQHLHSKGQRLTAFTSVPLSDTGAYVSQRFGDEHPLARAVAHQAGAIDLYPVSATSLTPIGAIRAMLCIVNEPGHAAGNFYWILELLGAARENGCRVLLTGQMGNAGVSWTGAPFSQPFFFQLRHFGWKQWSKELLKRQLPADMLGGYRKLRLPKEPQWQSSAIHPDFARRLKLREQLLHAPDSPWTTLRTPRQQRLNILKPGCSFAGALWHENGAAFGLDVRDPTADARLLAFCLSVPDAVFIDPQTGMDRWLIREAMQGRLPDEVRMNRKRGRQAADLVPRLRACADEVEDALDELAGGPAVEYLNVPHMRQVWRMIQTDDTPEAFHKSVTVLTRGIMAGLWVNGFYNAS